MIVSLTSIMSRVAQGSMTHVGAVRALRSCADAIEAERKRGLISPAGGATGASVRETSDVRTVFDHWKKKTGHARATLDGKRRKLISARLKDGLTVDDLKRLVDWAATSPFHQGENDRGKRYDWIENIMRSTSQVERNLEEAQVEVASDDDEIMRVYRRAQQAREDGDEGEYERLTDRVRNLRASKKQASG